MQIDNIKIRNYAELVNIITQTNKGGLLVYSLLLKNMYDNKCLFSIRVIYKDNSVFNKELSYAELIQYLDNILFSYSIKNICIFSDCYDIYFRSF